MAATPIVVRAVAATRIAEARREQRNHQPALHMAKRSLVIVGLGFSLRAWCIAARKTQPFLCNFWYYKSFRQVGSPRDIQ
jgi:hypothetical protein